MLTRTQWRKIWNEYARWHSHTVHTRGFPEWRTERAHIQKLVNETLGGEDL